ncbi:hypothetical protein CTI14_51800, partial [Methylobacterium radiotolerans]
LKHDITFGVGPAGTGKTWLAVACAIDAMERDTVRSAWAARKTSSRKSRPRNSMPCPPWTTKATASHCAPSAATCVRARRASATT